MGCYGDGSRSTKNVAGCHFVLWLVTTKTHNDGTMQPPQKIIGTETKFEIRVHFLPTAALNATHPPFQFQEYNRNYEWTLLNDSNENYEINEYTFPSFLIFQNLEMVFDFLLDLLLSVIESSVEFPMGVTQLASVRTPRGSRQQNLVETLERFSELSPTRQFPTQSHTVSRCCGCTPHLGSAPSNWSGLTRCPEINACAFPPQEDVTRAGIGFCL